jgi:hypothetical protein
MIVALPPESDIDGLECDVVSRALSDSYLRTTSVWVIRSQIAFAACERDHQPITRGREERNLAR